MITKLIYLKNYDWLIKVFCATNDYDEQILDELESIGCPNKILKSIDKLIDSDIENWGITYTNSYLHVTVIIIGKTSSADEFYNTLDHEKGHAAMHIAEFYDMNVEEEQFQYLQGKIGQEIFKATKKLLCDDCRKELFNNSK